MFNKVIHIAPKSLLQIIFLLLCTPNFAQQDALFSQYMVNHFVINPAYAGSRDAVSTFLINRNQWIAIPGAPKTAMFSVNSPIALRAGAGLQIINDQIGPKSTTGILGTYSYKLPFKKSNLAFGLRIGAYNYRFDTNKIEYKDQTDVYANQGVIQSTAFNADFGIYYYTDKFFAGLAINHLTNTLKTSDLYKQTVSNQYLSSHSFLSLGYTFEFTKSFAIQPSILLRQVNNAPVNADLNCNFMFNKQFWVGFSIRPENAFVLLTQAYVTEKFRVGYAYDMGVNKIGRVGRGAHEIFLGYDFSLKQKGVVHPRYF